MIKALNIGKKYYWRLWVTFIVVFSLGIALLIVHNEGSRKHNEHINSQLQNIAKQLNVDNFEQVKISLSGIVKQKYVISTAIGRISPDNPETIAAMSSVSSGLNADFIYLLDNKGKCVACTPFDNGKSLTGNYYTFRPYFTNIMRGDDSTFYAALGVTTGDRGIYVSIPITDGNEISGALVAKLNLSVVDQNLKSITSPVVMISKDGVVFASNKKEWMFKTVLPITEIQRQSLRETKQFATEELLPLGYDFSQVDLTLGEKKYEIKSSPIMDGQWKLVGLFSPFVINGVRFGLYSFFIWLLMTLISYGTRFYLGLIHSEQQLKDIVQQLNIEITERKQAEKALLESEEKLHHSQKMKAVGQLAGGMAHDFNNVLSGILSASQLLQLPEHGLNKKSRKYVGMIIQASERASDLISKLLAFSRKGQIATTTLDIHEILNDTVEILNRTIDKKITISVIKDAHNHNFIGDQSAIASAIINLGINASHAMPDKGVIQIKTKNIFLDQKYCDSSSFEITSGDYLKIEVIDTGCGIPKENLQKIFEPFYTTKEQGSGTGLGLSAVYGTIQDHHGIIEVHSEVGVGTTFSILLPSTIELNEQVNEMSPTLIGAGTVLLVDDEEMNRILNKEILESLGYSVYLAEDGQQSIEVFSKNYPEIDIVLMDMIMPKMNGSEAFYKMKEIDKNCKIIITSGYTQDENIDVLRQNGLAGYINKPYKISDISQLLNDVLKRG